MPVPPQTMTTMRFASGVSEESKTQAALADVLSQLRKGIDAPVDLALIFASPHHLGELSLVHDAITQALQPRVELGITAEGVIGVQREVEGKPGLSVLAASMPQARLHSFSLETLDWPHVLDDPGALRQAVNPTNEDPKLIVLLADPFTTPMVRLLPALNGCYPQVPIVGGMASGTRTPGGNRLLRNGRISREGAIGLSIGGGVHTLTTVSQGCRPVGRPLVITRTHPQRTHIIQELGGRKALQAIQDVVNDLSEEDQQLVQTHGLLVGRVINEYKDRFGRGDFLIRGIIGVDQEAGYVAIGDPQVRVGQTIQLHLRDQATAIDDFSLLLEAQKVHGPALGGLLFTCNGRGSRLFDQAHADADMIHTALGDVPLAGFFAAGEIGPIGTQNFLHGHTASFVAFRPSPSDPKPV